MTAEDDEELIEADVEGGATGAAIKAKHKTKGAFMGVLQKAGRKMAGFHGDVSVDGTTKQVRFGSMARVKDPSWSDES